MRSITGQDLQRGIRACPGLWDRVVQGTIPFQLLHVDSSCYETGSGGLELDKGKFPLSVRKKKQWQMWDLSGRGFISSQKLFLPVVPSLRRTGINYFWEIPRGCWIFFPSLFFFCSYSPPPSSLPSSPQISNIPNPGCGDATTKQQTWLRGG